MPQGLFYFFFCLCMRCSVLQLRSSTTSSSRHTSGTTSSSLALMLRGLSRVLELSSGRTPNNALHFWMPYVAFSSAKSSRSQESRRKSSLCPGKSFGHEHISLDCRSCPAICSPMRPGPLTAVRTNNNLPQARSSTQLVFVIQSTISRFWSTLSRFHQA